MRSKFVRLLMGLAVLLAPIIITGCGSGSTNSANSSGSTGQTPAAQTGSVNLVMSDASTEDWATIGVKVLAISLTPQGGGTPVSVYTAPTPAPTINLVQLDQLGEIIGNANVPAGTYTSATVTISGNSGDVLLTTSADPETGFASAASTTIPASQINIQGATGSAGSLTVPVNVNFASPLVVTAGQSNALDLEFDLAHPAFIVSHIPVGGGTTMWAVDFSGPVRRHPLADLTRLVLRHHYGTVTAVSSDDSSISMNLDFAVEPPTNPETALTSSQNISILADSTNGTLFYDLDAGTNTKITSFSAEASTIVGKYVRVAARYQANGTLVATRIWASSTFNTVWVSPEGHVLHVNTSTDVITVQNEVGVGIPLTVNSNTQFYFRTPWNGSADGTPIGTGTGFLTSHNFVRGFKVHASVVNPLATPVVASEIDIETARYDGNISNANSADFTYSRNFFTAGDDYSLSLDYISSNTQNINSVTGFEWWNFAFPTIINSGSSAVNNFISATNGGVNFGGNAGTFAAWGESYAWWNDPASPNAWALPWAVLIPKAAPLGAVAAGYANNAFTMNVLGGTNAVTAALNTTAGSATLVYQVDRTNNIVTITSVDITTQAGQNTIATNLVTGTPVKVFGVPQANGTIASYVVFYYTGVKSTL
jgi:hypothetical protein